MHLIAYVNGKFQSLHNAMIHIEDRGFQFADGVYEVVACYQDNFIEMDAHLQRLEQSCSKINLDLPATLCEIRNLIERAYRFNRIPNAMIYVQITRGMAPRTHAYPQNIQPSLIITVRPLPEVSQEKLAVGYRAITLEDIRWKHCDIKSIALLPSIMGKHEAQSRGADECFWVDEDKHILEGSSTNVFAIKGSENLADIFKANDEEKTNILLTHPLGSRILGGITRDLVIRSAKQLGMIVEERPWSLDENGITECFVSSTTNAAMSVCSVDDNPIGTGKPGSLTTKIRQLVLDEFYA